MTPDASQHWFLTGQTLAEGELPATIAGLSLAKRRALKLCLAGERLDDLGRKGWQHPRGSQRIDSRTIDALVADGLLSVIRQSRFRIHARLTKRGDWYARTIVSDIIAAAHRIVSEQNA